MSGRTPADFSIRLVRDIGCGAANVGGLSKRSHDRSPDSPYVFRVCLCGVRGVSGTGKLSLADLTSPTLTSRE